MSKPSEPAGTVPRWRSWSTLIAWGVAIAVLAYPRQAASKAGLRRCRWRCPARPPRGPKRCWPAEFGNTVPIAVLLRGPPAEVDRQGRRLVAALRDVKQVQVLSPWDGSAWRTLAWRARCAPPRERVRARELHPAREPRDGGGAEHRSRDRPHRAPPGAQLPDRRGGDRACAPGSHDGGHRAGRDDRAAGADPRAAARLPLAGGRRRAAGDGRRDRDGRPRAAVARELRDADQLAGSRDRRDDEPRARRRLRAADGLARAPGAGRRLRPRGGRGDRVPLRRAHDRRGGRHAGADDARGERSGDAGPARPGGDRSRHLGPSQRRAGADRDAGAAAPARPPPRPLGDPAPPLAPPGTAHRSGSAWRNG